MSAGAVRRLAALLLVVVASVGAGACADVSAGPDDAFQLEFDSLLSPAVARGDSLRDTSGNVRGLGATAFNYRGDTVQTPVRFLLADTARGITVDSVTGIVTASAAAQAASVRVVASVGTLQTGARTISIVQRPDSLAKDTTTDTASVAAVRFAGDTVTTAALRTRLTGDSSGTRVPVPQYGVVYRVAYPASAVADSAYFVDANGRPTGPVAITSAGAASLRVRLHRRASASATADSLVVLAYVRTRPTTTLGPVSWTVTVSRP